MTDKHFEPFMWREDLQIERDALRDENERLKEEWHTSEQERIALVDEIERLRAEPSDGSLGYWNRLVQTLTTENERLNTDLASWVHRQAELQAENERLKAQLINQHAEIEDLTRLSQSYLAEASEEKMKAAAAEAQNERLRAALTRYGRHQLLCSFFKDGPHQASSETLCDCGLVAASQI